MNIDQAEVLISGLDEDRLKLFPFTSDNSILSKFWSKEGE